MIDDLKNLSSIMSKQSSFRKSQFWNEDLIANFIERNPKTISTLFWSLDEKVIFKQLKNAIEQNTDIILSDLLPDELPNHTTNSEYDFFISRYMFVPPYYIRKNDEIGSPSSKNKIVFVTDSKQKKALNVDEVASIIASCDQFKENFIFLDADSQDIKNEIDKHIIYAKRIVINSINPNLIHYASILSSIHELSVYLIAPIIESSSRSILFGYNIKSTFNIKDISLRSLIKEIILSENTHIEVLTVNSSLRYISNNGEEDDFLNKILKIKEISNNLFSVNNNYAYSFNPTERNIFEFGNDLSHLNRFQVCFALNYIDYLNSLSDLTPYQDLNLKKLIDKLFISWLNSKVTDLSKLFLISFLSKNDNDSDRLIELSKKVDHPAIKSSFFAILSECYLRTSNINSESPEKAEKFKRQSIECLEIQNLQGSYNHYRFCYEISYLKFHKNKQPTSSDLSKYIINSGSNLRNSTNLMTILPFHCTTEALLSLPFESMSIVHVENLLHGILWEQGYSIPEILFYRSFEPKNLPDEIRELIMVIEDRVATVPWQLLLVSRLIQPQKLPAYANSFPTTVKIYLVFGLRSFAGVTESDELLKNMNEKDVVTEIEALFLLTLLDTNDAALFNNLNKKFDIIGSLERNNENFHPNFYPLIYKLSLKLDHSLKEYCKRLSDSKSSFFDAFD